MAEYRLRPSARTDLLEIWLWTDRTWSERQADTYVREMRREFLALAANPRRGRQSDDIPQGYWVKRFRSHYIFFLRERGGIDIIRVLHERMDFAQHLKDAP